MGHIILINKEYQKTSNNIVQVVKRYTESKKAGHAGTLDPLATGLLLIGTNEKTKSLSKIINFSKEYIVEIKFGEHRDTFDKEGVILKKNNYFPDLIPVKKVISYFLSNEYFQKVPIYSSVKINGKKLYEYARKKIIIDLPVKQVFINSIEMLEYQKKHQIVKLKMNVEKGFYVRSFAVDFAVKLKSYAYVYSLKRTKIENYNLENAINDYQDLWKYHSKVEFLDFDSKFSFTTKNLLVGHFDIIHLGQKQAFNYENLNVLTFINNPSKKEYFNSNLSRIWNLSELNVNKIIIYDISKANLNSDQFNKLILEKLNPEKIIVGSNFKYGNNLKNFENLKNFFNIDVIENTTHLSSTKIRKDLLEGNIEKVNNLHLNFIKFKGIVIDGNKRGRLLNFPTINVEWNTNLKMRSGSYISLTKIGNKIYPSTTFINEIKNEKILTETFIHDFNSSVYGKIVEIWPIDFINDFWIVTSKENLIKKISKEVFLSKNFHTKHKIKSVKDYLNFLKK